MAVSKITNPKGWTLRDTIAFSSITMITKTVTIPKGSYSEVLVVGGNLCAYIPLVGRTSYGYTSYNSYAGYGYRLQGNVTINDDSLVWNVRLEEKLNNSGYPTVQLYTR